MGLVIPVLSPRNLHQAQHATLVDRLPYNAPQEPGISLFEKKKDVPP